MAKCFPVAVAHDAKAAADADAATEVDVLNAAVGVGVEGAVMSYHCEDGGDEHDDLDADNLNHHPQSTCQNEAEMLLLVAVCKRLVAYLECVAVELLWHHPNELLVFECARFWLFEPSLERLFSSHDTWPAGETLCFLWSGSDHSTATSHWK